MVELVGHDDVVRRNSVRRASPAALARPAQARHRRGAAGRYRRSRAVLLPVSVAVLVGVLAGCGGPPQLPPLPTRQGPASSSSPTVPTPNGTSTSTSTVTSTSGAAVMPGQVPPNGTVFGDFREPSSGIDLTGSGGGDVHIIGSGNGFSVISASSDGTGDTSVLVAFDVDGSKLGTVPKGQFLGSCGAEDLTLADGRRLLFTELLTSTPAQGIVDPTYTLTLQAWDAASGQSVWQSPLTLPPLKKGEQVECHADGDGTLPYFAPTSDHAWAFVGDGRDLVTGSVVDLATGGARRVDQVNGTLGPYLIGPSQPDQYGTSKTALILDPGSGATLGSIPKGTVYVGSGGQAYAPGGVTPSRQADSPSAVLTADSQGIVATDGTALVRYDLPTGTVAWRHEAPTASDWLKPFATGGGIVVEGVQYGQSMAGLNDATGDQVWTLPVASTDVCVVTDSQMAVIANSQLAIIDVKTGKQLSYGPSPYAGVATGAALCPDSLPGGLGVAQSQVAQLAQP